MEIDDNSVSYLTDIGYAREYSYQKRRQLVWLLIVMIVLIGFFVCLISFVPPIRGILSNKEKVLASQLEGMRKIPDIERKLEILQSQIQILTTDTIDARLKALEKALEIGQLSSADISSLNDLKKEMLKLKTYLFSDPNEVVKFKELQSNYKKLSEAQANYATKDNLRSQISTLQTILTISLSFFGILFTVMFGSWWFVGRKATVPETPTIPIHKKRDSSNSIADETNGEKGVTR